MYPTYRHFEELRTKAQNKLKGFGSLEAQLANAVCEINMMRESEVPEYAWNEVQAIIKLCSTHEEIGEEGSIRASIDKMSYEEQKSLSKKITNL